MHFSQLWWSCREGGVRESESSRRGRLEQAARTRCKQLWSSLQTPFSATYGSLQTPFSTTDGSLQTLFSATDRRGPAGVWDMLLLAMCIYLQRPVLVTIACPFYRKRPLPRQSRRLTLHFIQYDELY